MQAAPSPTVTGRAACRRLGEISRYIRCHALRHRPPPNGFRQGTANRSQPLQLTRFEGMACRQSLIARQRCALQFQQHPWSRTKPQSILFQASSVTDPAPRCSRISCARRRTCRSHSLGPDGNRISSSQRLSSLKIEGAAGCDSVTNCAFADASRTRRAAGRRILSTTQNPVTLFEIEHRRPKGAY